MVNKSVTIIDVRTPAEFMGGHVSESINIPLQELSEHIEKIRGIDTPIVLCCASGNRSGMAMQILMKAGIECENGGGWMDVNGKFQ